MSKEYLELPSTISNGRNMNQLLADNQRVLHNISQTLKGLVFLARNEFDERKLAMFCHGAWFTVGAAEIGGLISKYFWVPYGVTDETWSTIYQYLIGPDSSLTEMKDFKLTEEQPEPAPKQRKQSFIDFLLGFLR